TSASEKAPTVHRNLYTGSRVAPPNSTQHPMRGRRLARRFRGSDIATRCVALPERPGRARGSVRVVGRTEWSVGSKGRPVLALYRKYPSGRDFWSLPGSATAPKRFPLLTGKARHTIAGHDGIDHSRRQPSSVR